LYSKFFNQQQKNLNLQRDFFTEGNNIVVFRQFERAQFDFIDI
jgi:hypothetical protein